ncbi:MAG TPA: response regulator [Verrucomicrobiae bacterium]|jgi:CheY-like chemotaxis protein
METTHKILVLDDDADWLDMSRDFLAQLPSKPEIRTVASGTRALTMLEAQPFRLFICDLRMPRMDGLQVLSIVRRRFPDLCTVVLTGLHDDEFRSRAYALGVDLFWIKSDMQHNPQMFLDCLESLLGREDAGGFRGVQSKSLVDLIRMECLSRSSSVLRITSGPLVAQLWIENGELVDAQVEGADGEAAFRRILKWKSGAFENLPADLGHTRTITKSVDALLLEAAQTDDLGGSPNPAKQAGHQQFVERLTALAYEGAEFVVSIPSNKQDEVESWAIQDTKKLVSWVRHVEKSAQRIGDNLNAGPLNYVAGHNLECRLLLLPQDGKTFVVGWPPAANAGRLLEQTKKLANTWAS